jgi:AraC-like DNA-binding protein
MPDGDHERGIEMINEIAASAESKQNQEITCRAMLDNVALLLSRALLSFQQERGTADKLIQQAAELLKACSTIREGEKGPKTCKGGLTPWQVARIRKYLAASIGDTIRVPELAHITRLSRGHFNKAFRKSFGTSPHAYITACRIEHAKVLMREGRQPLSQIALACGFSDQAQLSRLFRKEVGLMPSAWRREIPNRNGHEATSESDPTHWWLHRANGANLLALSHVQLAPAPSRHNAPELRRPDNQTAGARDRCQERLNADCADNFDTMPSHSRA